MKGRKININNSNCKVEPRGGWSGLTPYCAYCGAKMTIPDTVYEEVQEEKVQEEK
jgi:hypothetical protein